MPTIGVMGSGLDVVYPGNHFDVSPDDDGSWWIDHGELLWHKTRCT
ncbi:MAG: hypothetical protein WDO15_17425 [Bacteroidota bacterium]